MVDVWEELGKALGRALRPLAEIPGAMWRSLQEAAGDMARGFMAGAGQVGQIVEPMITPLMTQIMEEATRGVTAGSPPEEIEEAAKKLAEALMKLMEDVPPKKGESPPALVDLQRSVALITAGAFGLYGGTSVISMALDAVHPIKDLGFKAAAMDILHTFSVQDVVEPMVHAPLWSGVIAPLRLRMNQLYPYAVPGIPELGRMKSTGIITEELYKENMSFHSLDATWADRMATSWEKIPDFADLREMLWRRAKDEPALREALIRQGIRSDFLDAYMELTSPRIGSGDLITMVIREAFMARPGDEEMPDRFVQEMSKWGLDREACLWHWRSHWRLPALGEVFDMHHRDISMPYTVDAFLKWADYSPEWRGPLEKLSWRLPGRIDARWMYRWGLTDVAGLQDLLVKDGLDPEYAPDVAMATAKNQWLTEINKLRDNSKSDYAKGYIGEEQLRADLEALGYPATWIDFHVQDATEDAERTLKTDAVAVWEDAWLKDQVTEAELTAGLGAIIVRPEVVEMSLERLYLRKYKKLRGV